MRYAMNCLRGALLVLLVCTCLLSSGCMTIGTQAPYWNGDRPESPKWDDSYFFTTRYLYIYAGVLNDVLILKELWEAPVSIWREEGGFFFSGVTALCLIDAPLCLVADTIILPITIYQQIKISPVRLKEIDQDQQTRSKLSPEAQQKDFKIESYSGL